MKKLSYKSMSHTIDTRDNVHLGEVEITLSKFLKKGGVKIKEEKHKIYEKNEYGVKKSYDYFLIHRPDLSDGKYYFSQILILRNSGYLTSGSKYLFYTRDMVYEKQKERTQGTTIEDAIRWFEEKFSLNTGIDWLSWCQLCSGKEVEINRNCFYDWEIGWKKKWAT